MDQGYEFFLALHIYSLYASGFLMLFYLSLTQSSFKTEFYFIRRIRLFLPIYYFFLSIIIFTGLLLLALNHFHLNLYLILMIVAWLGILALAIIHFKLFKKARITKKYFQFKNISLLILLLELALLFAPYIIKQTYL